MLRHRHTLEEGYQQTDLQLVEIVEMSELKCSLFLTAYLVRFKKQPVTMTAAFCFAKHKIEDYLTAYR